jgi:hypothetical protein
MKLGITHRTKRLMVGLALAVVLVVIPLVVYADNLDADADIATVGSQQNISLTKTPGATVSLTSQIIVTYQGQKHLTAGSAITFTGNSSDLPTGYSVGNASGSVPNPWNSGSFGLNSAITFTAPSTPGSYTYHVSWDPTTYTCAQSGCLSGNPQIVINLTVSPPPDSTPPVITPNVSGTLGNNGWYVSNVTVSWTVSDPESTITSQSGCGTTSITTDTAGQTLTCTATSAGGTSSHSVTIKRDATKPTASASATANGGAYTSGTWTNKTVTVSFTGTDNMSGIAGCTAAAVLSSDGANQSALGTCTDNAGNVSNSVTFTGINIDKTPPTLTGSRSPAANSYGWNNTDVTVSFTCTDGLAGVATPPVSPQVVSTEGAGQSRSATCTDNAGNTASVTVNSINIDKTKPTASASASPGPNANGWNNTDVTVSFDGSDSLSGIDACSPPVTLSSEGAGQSASGTCTDKAGNVSDPATASGINIDKTPPTLDPSVSPNLVVLNGSATASPNASDNLSGVATSSCGSVTTSAIGSYTVNCTATDKADNTATASVSYNVIYDFGGFLPPLTADGRDTFKKGSVVPVKFQLKDANGNFVTNATASLTVFYLGTAVAPADEPVINIVGAGDSGNTFRYDLTSNQYIFNWSTKGLNWTGKFRLIVNLYGASSPFNPSVEIYLK